MIGAWVTTFLSVDMLTTALSSCSTRFGPRVRRHNKDARVRAEHESLPDLVTNGYYLLGKDWLETARSWQEAGAPTPPVMRRSRLRGDPRCAQFKMRVWLSPEVATF